MECLECGKQIPLNDTTYSNINTKRATVGQYTGDIYYCEECGLHFIDNFLNGRYEPWSY